MSTKEKILEGIDVIARFSMGVMWIIAGATKLGNRVYMTQIIEAYEIFTPEWSGYLAVLIGPLEIAGGLFLILGLFLRQASQVGIFVLILFIIGIAQAWMRGLEISCGCFGEKVIENYPLEYAGTIIRDIILIILHIWIIKRPYKRFALYP